MKHSEEPQEPSISWWRAQVGKTKQSFYTSSFLSSFRLFRLRGKPTWPTNALSPSCACSTWGFNTAISKLSLPLQVWYRFPLISIVCLHCKLSSLLLTVIHTWTSLHCKLVSSYVILVHLVALVELAALSPSEALSLAMVQKTNRHRIKWTMSWKA